MRSSLVLVCKGNKSNFFPGAYLCIAYCILMCKPWHFSLLFTFLNVRHGAFVDGALKHVALKKRF